MRGVGPGPVARKLPLWSDGAPWEPREAIIRPSGVGELGQNIQRCAERERKVSQSHLCPVQLVGIGGNLKSTIHVILLVIQHRLVHQRRREDTRDVGCESDVCTVPAGQVERHHSNGTGTLVAQALNVVTVTGVGTCLVVDVPVHSADIQPAAVLVRKDVEIVDAVGAGVVRLGKRIGDR